MGWGGESSGSLGRLPASLDSPLSGWVQMSAPRTTVLVLLQRLSLEEYMQQVPSLSGVSGGTSRDLTPLLHSLLRDFWARSPCSRRGEPGPRLLWPVTEGTSLSSARGLVWSHVGLLPLRGDSGATPQGRGRQAPVVECSRQGPPAISTATREPLLPQHPPASRWRPAPVGSWPSPGAPSAMRCCVSPTRLPGEGGCEGAQPYLRIFESPPQDTRRLPKSLPEIHLLK